MLHTEQVGTLRVNVETKECELPSDELPRIKGPLNRIAQVVGDLPGELNITIVHHPRSERFHVREQLKLPRRSVFTGDWNEYLDSALCRSLRKLIRKAEAYKQESDNGRDKQVERVARMHREVVAPENSDMGQLAEAVAAGDYTGFRSLLAGHEEWLRLRVGRWLQRYPDAEAEVGRRVKIGDLVEEVLLNAFEQYSERSDDVPLRDWLNSLIDPSLLDYCRHPAEERENISFVRSLRAPPRSPDRKPHMTNKSHKKKKTVSKWSGKIQSVSTFPPEGTFKKDAKSVARIMATKKVSPKGIGSGIRMITMYINRAGKDLDPNQRKELEEAKQILRAKADGRPSRGPGKAAHAAGSRKRASKTVKGKRKSKAKSRPTARKARKGRTTTKSRTSKSRNKSRRK